MAAQTALVVGDDGISSGFCRQTVYLTLSTPLTVANICEVNLYQATGEFAGSTSALCSFWGVSPSKERLSTLYLRTALVRFLKRPTAYKHLPDHRGEAGQRGGERP